MKANLNSTYTLGNRIKYYRPDWINIIPHFLLTEFFVVFISTLCAALTYTYFLQNQPKIVLDIYILLILSILAVITIFVCATSITRVYLYQHGLVYKCGWWMKVILYEKIEDISFKITSYQRYGQTMGTAYVYKLGIKNAQKLTLDGRICKIAELGQSIESEIVERYLPEALLKFKAGEVLKFGEWQVSLNGLNVSWASISWSDIDRVKIENGKISIYRVGKEWGAWGTTPVYQVPNLAIFLEIIERNCSNKMANSSK